MMHFNRNIDDRPSVYVEKLENIPGSTAGAGSGEYYTYRNRRRDELARENEMRALEAERKKQEDFEKYKMIEKKVLEKKRNKKKARRDRRKANRKQAKLAKKLNKFGNSGNFIEQFLKKKIETGQEKENEDNTEKAEGDNAELGKREKPETKNDSSLTDETVTKKLKTEEEIQVN